MRRVSHAKCAEEMRKALWSIDQWLLDHANKRPAYEVEIKRERRDAFAQSLEDHERAAAHEREKSA